MSLEQAISDHAAALRELAAAILTTATSASKITIGGTPAADKAENNQTDAKAKATDAKAQGGAKAVVTEAIAKAKADAKAPAPTYDDVKAKVLELSKAKGREPTVALLQRYGVEKAPDILEEQYPAFIKDVDAILAGTYEPEDAELA